MSNKNIYMGKIKQILLQDKAGVSQRQIARNLGVNRETVGKYLKKQFAAGQYKNIDLKFADAASYQKAIGDLLTGSDAYIFTLVREANPGFSGRIAFSYNYVDDAHYICLTVTLKK